MMTNYDCATEMGYKAHVRRNDPPCQICKDWMAKVKAGEASKPAPIKSKREVASCGTSAGYENHRRAGEPACKACREARSEYKRKLAAGKRTSDGRLATNLRPCGTDAAYQRHKRAGEEPCDPCKVARREKSTTNRAKAKAKATKREPVRELIPCGTTAAYLRHRRAGETPCDPCRAAEREASRLKRARAKARKAA